MSAFQSYAGVYSFHGQSFRWRCYASKPMHALRCKDHAPLPNAPVGQKWISPSNSRAEPEVALLVDQDVGEISQILLHVEAIQAEARGAIPAAAGSTG